MLNLKHLVSPKLTVSAGSVPVFAARLWRDDITNLTTWPFVIVTDIGMNLPSAPSGEVPVAMIVAVGVFAAQSTAATLAAGGASTCEPSSPQAVRTRTKDAANRDMGVEDNRPDAGFAKH